MAPQRKRGANDSEEVCKRIKEDIKDAKVVADQSNDTAEQQKEPATVKKSEDDNKPMESNNNNNNNNGAESLSNGSVKQDSGDTTAAEQKDEAPGSQVNGDAKKADAPVKSEVVSQPEPEKQTSSKESESKSDVNGSEKAKPAAEPKTEEKKKEDVPLEEATSGVLLICGGANWDMTGRKELPKAAKKPVEVDPAARNLWGPHKVVLDGKTLRVKGVFSGCNACHSVIVTADGETMTFGRNDKGQLGIGPDLTTKVTPVTVDALDGIDIVSAACGRSHTLFLSSDGIVYACGDNKMGQCGTNQQSVQQITTPQRIAFRENKKIVKIACGAEFSMIVDEDGRLYSFGHPENGQLGHNSEAKYFTSGNKYAFHCEYAPRRIVTFIEKSREGHVSPAEDVRIVDVACGTSHTLAVDTKHRCFSWGFAGYHRLGHSETKNELVPRSIRLFDVPPSTGRGCVRVFAGASFSMALDVNGLLYFWGQNKSSGEATMYPKNVQDLCGWRISHVACANRSIFVVAEDTCISWGPSPTYGELGYGDGKSKSSTTPNEVKTLEGTHIINVTCGFGHTLLIARDRAPEEAAHIEKNFKNWP
uniref:Protein RCC2 n=2 Tax=Aceria tosichella TaxID=561515 RepID=A0A6G1S701_9ACAR